MDEIVESSYTSLFDFILIFQEIHEVANKNSTDFLIFPSSVI